MSNDYLSKQAFAESLAIRHAVIMLISFLPDEKKALVKEYLSEVAADFSSIPLENIPGITPEISEEFTSLIADAFLNLAELASASEDPSPTPHQ